MISTTVLAVIGGMAVILVAAARIPAAAAELIRACIVLVDAIKDLRAALRRPAPDASADAKTPHRHIRG
jgi:Sec-independent protein translocase protein TatA